MSYNIGQLRKNEITKYSTTVPYKLDLIKNDNGIVDFYDPCIFLENLNMMSSSYNYYVRFEITQSESYAQNFTVKLKNDNNEDSTQEIEDFTVKIGTGKTTFELIISPNSTYNKIIFELRREILDFNFVDPSGKQGRIMDIKILDFYIVNNVIKDYLANNYPNLTKLKKIGIQSQPGFLFVLDGEPIRVGRTGIYELYHENISISYIGFIIRESKLTQDGEDFFIMDFKY